jgi:lipid A 3-O-deacylase
MKSEFALSIYRRLLVALMLFGIGIGNAGAGDLSVLWGGGERQYRNRMLTYGSKPFWADQYFGYKVDVRIETSLGLVTSSSSLQHDNLVHIGITPVAQLWLSPATALELGIGANVFSGTHLGEKPLSTAFQFGDSLGVFHRFSNSPWTAGLRFTHYSNADIKRPNPGQNYLQLRVSYSLD